MVRVFNHFIMQCFFMDPKHSVIKGPMLTVTLFTVYPHTSPDLSYIFSVPYIISLVFLAVFSCALCLIPWEPLQDFFTVSYTEL